MIHPEIWYAWNIDVDWKNIFDKLTDQFLINLIYNI